MAAGLSTATSPLHRDNVAAQDHAEPLASYLCGNSTSRRSQGSLLSRFLEGSIAQSSEGRPRKSRHRHNFQTLTYPSSTPQQYVVTATMSKLSSIPTVVDSTAMAYTVSHILHKRARGQILFGQPEHPRTANRPLPCLRRRDIYIYIYLKLTTSVLSGGFRGDFLCSQRGRLRARDRREDHRGWVDDQGHTDGRLGGPTRSGRCRDGGSGIGEGRGKLTTFSSCCTQIPR